MLASIPDDAFDSPSHFPRRERLRRVGQLHRAGCFVAEGHDLPSGASPSRCLEALATHLVRHYDRAMVYHDIWYSITVRGAMFVVPCLLSALFACLHPVCVTAHADSPQSSFSFGSSLLGLFTRVPPGAPVYHVPSRTHDAHVVRAARLPRPRA